MSAARLLNRFSVRGKINLALVPVMALTVAIAGLSFVSHRSGAITDSQRIVGLILESGAGRLADTIAVQEKLALDWAAQDTWGVSIDYDMTGELGGSFAALLGPEPQTSLVVLTDVEGRILSGSHRGEPDLDDLPGTTNPDAVAAASLKPGELASSVGTSSLLTALGETQSLTLKVVVPVTGSSGKIAGYLCSYLDWATIDNELGLVRERLHEVEYDHAAVVLVPATAAPVLSFAGDGAPEAPAGEMAAWIAADDSTSASRVFEYRGGRNFVRCAPVGLGAGSLRLVAFVPPGDVLAEVNRSLRTNALIGLVGLLALGAGLWLLARQIALPLQAAITTLGTSFNGISEASRQVSDASHEIASGANEQAAGLQQTTATMIDLDSLTQQNTGRARQAADHSHEAESAAERSHGILNRLNETIGRIRNSSEETARILKTIDEIAFQTNLLALNAAVEAARAGDAGKGFAVVAEEVRNLAHRSAQAAQETSDLIQLNRQNSDDGVKVAEEVQAALQSIITSVRETSGLIEEVAQASGDQAGRLGATKNAVIQIEAVTQRNAASSEQAAAASREMAEQADLLEQLVATLQDIVEGEHEPVR